MFPVGSDAAANMTGSPTDKLICRAVASGLGRGTNSNFKASPDIYEAVSCCRMSEDQHVVRQLAALS